MNCDERAKQFLQAVVEYVAHGDTSHREWLESEIQRWARPLARLLDEVHQRGMKRGQEIVAATGADE